MKTLTILASLDEIFDSRIGTLQVHRPDLVTQEMVDRYVYRPNDRFGDLSVQQFRELYNQRDVNVLMHSPLCEAVKLIQKLCVGAGVQYITTPFVDSIRLLINTHPYQLTDAERGEILTQLESIFTQDVNLELVDMNIDQLTPAWCRDQLDYWLCYEYDYWVAKHMVELLAKPALGMTVITPAMLKSEMPDEHVRMEFTPNDLFQMASETCSTMFKLVHVELRSWCIFAIEE